MSFIDRVLAAKGDKARELVPTSRSIPELQTLMIVDSRRVVRTAARSRINKLRADEQRRIEEGVRPAPKPDVKPDPVEKRKDEDPIRTCPRCLMTGLVKILFGTRKMKRTRRDNTDVFTTRAQSFCKKCRGEKKAE